MKVLILATYYCRPKLVRNLLQSIKVADLHHSNWEMVCLDDNSTYPLQPIVKSEVPEFVDKIKIWNSNMTFEDKCKNGLKLGHYANKAITESNADIAIIVGDDDELYPTYLKDISDYFFGHPKVMYAYSKVILYNPIYQSSNEVSNHWNKYNNYVHSINPVNKLDSTQVAWRLDCCKVLGAKFAETTKFFDDMPWIHDADKSFFESLYEACGEAEPTGLIAQYKGVHEYQLLWHKKADEVDLKQYDQMVRGLAGKVL